MIGDASTNTTEYSRSSQSLPARIRGERLIAHNLIVGSGTFAAGVLGVSFQVLVSHRLHPAEYSSVFAVITILTLIGLPATGFTLLMARQSSTDRAIGDNSASATLLQAANRTLLLVGVLVAVILGAATPVISAFFTIPSPILLAAVPGIPFAIALTLVLGELQGQQRFKAFAAVTAGQALLKLLASVALGAVLGPVGIIAGISIAAVATYIVASYAVRQKLTQQIGLTQQMINRQWWRPATAYMAVVLPSTVALAALLSTDVLLVKHYFSDQSAGEYSAVAAIGRAVFWGATGVAAVLFPKVIYSAVQGRGIGLLVGASLALVALAGALGAGVLWKGSTFLLAAFAGPVYAGGASYLPTYAMAMTLLGAVSVLVATHQSSGKPAFLALLIPAMAIEPLLIAAFHQNLMQVVQVVAIMMGFLAAALGGLLAYQLRSAGAGGAPSIIPTAATLQSLEVKQ